MKLDSHYVFSHVVGVTDIPPDMPQEAFEEDYGNLPKLKAQMEILIKELIFMAVVVSGLASYSFYSSLLTFRPGLAGLYFRDVGYFSLPSSSTAAGTITHLESHDTKSSSNKTKEWTTTSSQAVEDPRCYRINQFFRARLESLMNQEYSHRVTVTVCSNLMEVPDPFPEEENTYENWHLWFIEHGTKLKTPPLRFPPFSIDQFLAAVPDVMTLADVDKTLSAGWANRREARAGTDVKTAHDLLQVSDLE